MELEVKQLVTAIKLIAEEKNLPEDSVHDAIEQAIVAAWKKDNDVIEVDARAELNTNTGDLTVFVKKNITDDVVDDSLDISLKDAKAIDKDAKLGGEVEETFKPTRFGRVAAQTAKQVIIQNLREYEREIILEEFSDKVGTVVNGVVARVEPKLIRVDLGKAQGIMPVSEQVFGERYTVGSRIKAFLRDVEKTGRGPQLILSRASEDFMRYLFASEVPEMENGAVEIKRIVREAGGRTKLAVASSVPGVDPVGTFVGGHGTRVQAVSGELNDIEKIDIIPYSEDEEEYIRNALSPTEIKKIDINKKDMRAKVFVVNDQLSIAIGKSGQNVRLASKLTGFEIDIEEAGASAADNSDDEKVSAPNKEVSGDKDIASNEDSDEEKNNKVDNNVKVEEVADSTGIGKTEQNRIKSKSQVEEDMLATIAAASDGDNQCDSSDDDNKKS